MNFDTKSSKFRALNLKFRVKSLKFRANNLKFRANNLKIELGNWNFELWAWKFELKAWNFHLVILQGFQNLVGNYCFRRDKKKGIYLSCWTWIYWTWICWTWICWTCFSISKKMKIESEINSDWQIIG